MTIVFDDSSNDPGTHALLIGVGKYPFLYGGDQGEAARLPHHMKMGQLSSPSHSVRAFANWLTDDQQGFLNDERPLRSLQLLCSGAAPISWGLPGQPEVDIARANMASVRQGIIDWKGRSSRNPENMAIFYFCGHGMQMSASESSLLMEDFGSDHADPMQHAIAFASMRLGLQAQCAAKHQVHFIDACRTHPTDAFLDTYGADSAGQRVIAGALSSAIRRRLSPVFFATGLLSAAYGQPGQPSIFMQGMLKCFRGVGSRENVDRYEVIPEAIGEGINKCVESLAFSKVPQYCQPQEAGHPFTFHRIRGDPEVLVKLFTRDESRLPDAVLAHTRIFDPPQAGVPMRQERQPQPTPWWVPLPLGRYLFEAMNKPDASLIGKLVRDVQPPVTQVPL